MLGECESREGDYPNDYFWSVRITLHSCTSTDIAYFIWQYYLKATFCSMGKCATDKGVRDTVTAIGALAIPDDNRVSVVGHP
ncbi:hypothetical protein J6590_035627 [Homalodisca vitripennis]|nr:hypothetical protein J6590_035627 [Homalodisca vitripennis]